MLYFTYQPERPRATTCVPLLWSRPARPAWIREDRTSARATFRFPRSARRNLAYMAARFQCASSRTPHLAARHGMEEASGRHTPPRACVSTHHSGVCTGHLAKAVIEPFSMCPQPVIMHTRTVVLYVGRCLRLSLPMAGISREVA